MRRALRVPLVLLTLFSPSNGQMCTRLSDFVLAIVSDCSWRNVTLWWEHQLGTLSSGDRFGVSKSVFPPEEQSKSRWRCCTTTGQRTRQRRHAATVVCFRKLRRDLRAATGFISRNMVFFSSGTKLHELLPLPSCLHG